MVIRSGEIRGTCSQTLCDEFATSCTSPGCEFDANPSVSLGDPFKLPWGQDWTTIKGVITCQYKSPGKGDRDVTVSTLQSYEQEPATNMTCPQVLASVTLRLLL